MAEEKESNADWFLGLAENNNGAEWECGDRDEESLTYYNKVESSIAELRAIQSQLKEAMKVIKLEMHNKCNCSMYIGEFSDCKDCHLREFLNKSKETI